MKRLFRSQKNKIVAGIFGGLGEYLNVDPVLLRFGFVLLWVFTGFVPGIIAYFFSWMIVPPVAKT